MSGVVPPGKPTKILIGLVGQLACGLLTLFWAVADTDNAQAATKNAALRNWVRRVSMVLVSLNGVQGGQKAERTVNGH
jgi:hypothetical protein